MLGQTGSEKPDSGALPHQVTVSGWNIMSKGKEARTQKNTEFGWSATILYTLMVSKCLGTFLVLQLTTVRMKF